MTPAAEKRQTYWEMLRRPEWQRRRLEILERAGWRCECCFNNISNLQVHHKLYRRGAKPWEYADRELVALCEDCHALVGFSKARLNELLALVPDYLVDQNLMAMVVGAVLSTMAENDGQNALVHSHLKALDGVTAAHQRLFTIVCEYINSNWATRQRGRT